MSTGNARVYDLSAARPEGWFDQVLEQSPDFARACQIIGRSTLALGLIAGARISSLTPSASSQSTTEVEFVIGEDPTLRQVPLSEFRETIASYLLAPLRPTSLPEDPDIEVLQAYIGGRYMLAASLFHVKPIELRHDLGLSEIKLEFNGSEHVLTLEDFREVIDERVRAELGLGQMDEGAAIDLGLVDAAEEANAEGNWSATVAMLTPWVTPISMLLRTGESEQLGEDAHARLADGLDLLGTAYANLGDFESANEVLRLGVQWAGESSKAADLFLTLGRASVAGESYGEAIGLLRRALRLGADEAAVMPLLARSLAAREQRLAALVVLERARDVSSDADAIDEIRTSLDEPMGETWARFERWMSDAQ